MEAYQTPYIENKSKLKEMKLRGARGLKKQARFV